MNPHLLPLLTDSAWAKTFQDDEAAKLERELTALGGERDQLRAEVERLRVLRSTLENLCDEQNEALTILTLRWDKLAKEQDQLRARAQRAEAAETVALANWNGALERAIKAEAELAAERARLNWLEDSSVCYHVCIGRQPDGYSIHDGAPSPGSVRAAIDAAMKEDST